MRKATTVLAAVAIASPAAAKAQAYQCRMPGGPVSVPQVDQDGPMRDLPIAGYTLALSWSPEYCKTRQDSAKDARQCSGRGGRFGLIVHGLWPKAASGSWPQWCRANRPLTGRELARNLCMTPSARLLAEEWVKHGSCMAAAPEGYFGTARILWRSLQIPDYDRLSRKKGLTAGDIRAAFAEANAGWRPENIGVILNERGWLRELRLCYSRSFRPTNCGEARMGATDSEPAQIWRGL